MLPAVVGEHHDGLIQALDAEVLLPDVLSVARRRYFPPRIAEDSLEAIIDDLQIGRRVLSQGCLGKRMKTLSNFPSND